jgi:predicted transcriptional regulator
MKNSYLRFLRIVSALEIDARYKKELCNTALQLLNEIAIKDHDSEPLTVSQAMDLAVIGSPANLHRKLQDLHRVGLVSIESKDKDRRVKYITLTKDALDYFKSQSDAMLKALKT